MSQLSGLLIFLLPLLSFSHPNIILMMADDLGWADVTPNNPENKNTPHIAALADKGLRFTDFHSAAPICTPARAGLLTGRMGQRTGVVANFGPGSLGGLPLTEFTMANYMRRAGYKTAIIGKWHLGIQPDYHPLSRGFDYYYGLPYSNDMGCVSQGPVYNIKVDPFCPGNPFNLSVPLFENRNIIEQPVDLTTLTSRYITKSTEFMTAALSKGRNFFLYVPMTHVHVPLATSPQFANKSKDGHFGDVLMEMDSYVGHVTRFLKDKGIDKETIVMFTSDNGPWEYKCNLAGSNVPYVGGWQKAKGGGGGSAKATTWEGGHRVPFIISWPGVIKSGVSNDLASALDILPTLAHITGVELASDRVYDGVQLPLFEPCNATRTLFLFGDTQIEIRALRYGKYKVFYATNPYPDCGNSTGRGFLYHNPALVFDLSLDPGETTPLTDLPGTFYTEVENLMNTQRHSIYSTFRSTVDWSSDNSKVPCCNHSNPYCNCVH